jgi:large subunit ribosomal protein L31e
LSKLRSTPGFLFCRTFKKKAPKAIKVIKQFAESVMKTKDVRVDTKLNKAVWAKGIRNVPRRIRVRISRKRNDDEDAKEELFSYVTAVDLPEGFSNVGTKIVEDDE